MREILQSAGKALIFFVLATTITCVVMAPGQVQAQASSQGTDEFSSRYFEKQPRKLLLSLIRKPELTSEQFILRLSVPAILSGCPKLSNLPYEVSFNENIMTVTTKKYTVDLRDLPNAPHYACDQRTRLPAAEIPLSREQLTAQNINSVEFISGPYIDYYKLILSEDYIHMVPAHNKKALPAFHEAQYLPHGKDALLYWFFPEDTVILYVPGSRLSENAKEQAAQTLAEQYELSPMAEYLPGFISPLAAEGFYYYVDKNDKLPDSALTMEGNILGTASVPETVYGLDGAETATKTVTVFAKLPGMYQ